MKCNPLTRSHPLTLAACVVPLVWALLAASNGEAFPTGGQTTQGNVSIGAPAGNTMTINQTSPRGVVEWTDFSIGAGQTVQIVQPSTTAALLNRVVGDVPSTIAGTLNATGRVFIVNPQGIIFSGTAVVNVGALVASSIDVNATNGEINFMNGIYQFNGRSINQPVTVTAGAQLTAGGPNPEANLANRGTIALLGGAVQNDGTVTARLGTVAMAGGGDVTLDFAGDGLTTVVINSGARSPTLTNNGTLSADGGLVSMSVEAAVGLASLAVNQTGIVRAQSLVQRNGHIMLDGGPVGTVSLSGTFDASGGAGLTGGRMDITGQRVAVQSPVTFDAAGAAGGGSVNIGVGPAASGNNVTRIANAVWVGPSSVIDVNATDTGNGGQVVLQAGASVQAFGVMAAQGGPNGGNGGSIETSAYFVDTSAAALELRAPAGTGGLWLFDTGSLVVGNFAPTVSTGPFTPVAGAGVSTVNASQVNTVLNQGASVTLHADAAFAASGTVEVDQSIAKIAGGDATLTLAAARGLTINPFPDDYTQPNANITSVAGKLNLVMQGGSTGVPGGDISIGSASRAPQLLTNGGDVIMGSLTGQPGTFEGDAMVLTNARLDTRVGAAANAPRDDLPSGSVLLRGAGAVGILLSGTTITTSSGQISAQVSSNPSANPACNGPCQVGGITIGNAFYAPPQPPGNDTVGTYQLSTLRTTSGSIQLFGAANDTGLEARQGEFGVLAPVNGVYVYQGSSIRTDSGNIDARGVWTNQAPAGSVPTAPFPTEYGLALDTATLASNSGQISLSAQGGTGSAMLLNAATVGGGTSTGNIVLRAANSQSAAGAAAASIQFGATANTISSTGALNAHPGGVGTDFSLTAADTIPITLYGTAPGMSFTAAQLAQFQGFHDVIFGSDAQTGAITVTALLHMPGVGNMTLVNNGAGSYGIDLQQGASLGGANLTLSSAGQVTDPGGIQAAGLLLAGPGTFTLTDPQNLVGVLAMANAGNVTFLNSSSFVIGPLVSKSFDSATNTVTTIDGTNSTLTGNLVATAATGNIGLGGAVPTPAGPNTNLSSSGGSVDLVLEHGFFTDAGTGALSAANGWRVWALTWIGETRGNVQPNTVQPNFYGCEFGTGCTWAGTVPATGNHFVYVDRPTVTVTAGDATRLIGAQNPTFTHTTTGLINGDTEAGTLSGTLRSPATPASPGGQYPIDPNFSSSVGYIVTNVPGTLTIIPQQIVVTPRPGIFDPVALSGLQTFFGNNEKTFVYENNLQGTNICVGSNQPLFSTAPPGDTQDLLAVEWKRVRSQPNLNSCMVLNGQHGCGDF